MDFFPYLIGLFIASLVFFGWIAFRSDRFMSGNRKRIQESIDRQREAIDRQRESMDLQRESIGLQRESLSVEGRLSALLEEQVRLLTELRDRLPAVDKHP